MGLTLCTRFTGSDKQHNYEEHLLYLLNSLLMIFPQNCKNCIQVSVRLADVVSIQCLILFYPVEFHFFPVFKSK